MAMNTSMGLSPFQLVCRKACHLPMETEHKALWALKFLNFDPHETQNKRRRLKLFPRKLKGVRQHGAIELVDLVAGDPQRSWVVNGQRLKHYLGGEVERLSTVM
ncbi:uncharacterized protein LOC124831512 [Vigna umbellata]|uniref:uncharacterized protein LOC124831512 n=1 Tax=Vigna umbellata TaxID=87088 RepID=UPI001F5E6621|nr:uncharacterized protein LOC124831512 [Vigna umbellata]